MKKAILFILCSYCSLTILAQSSGTVKDKASGKGISSVNVFISELNQGTITDSAGKFSFATLPPGKFHMQFSHVGYGSYVAVVNTALSATLEVELSLNAIETDEIVITAPYNSAGDKTAYNIDVIGKDVMRSSGELTLTGAISHIPGVNQLSTGSGITKPIIRGLRSNRVLTVLNGFRFDNQQWQDEHALGLGDMGIERVEVIKGPASVLYGSDAMGGVINLVEEEPAPIGKTSGSFNMKFNTNTLQAGSEITVKRSTERMNWRINLGGESNTNYLDAKKAIAFNTRFNGTAFKLSIGFNRKKFVSIFNYNYSDYHFGFVDAGEFFKPKINYDEERFSRTMEDAYHIVKYNLFFNKTTFFLPSSRIVMDVGLHLNDRNENEGALERSQGIGNMELKLNNYSLNLRWIKPIGEKHELMLGTQDMFVTNKNAGDRYLVPNSNAHELSAFVFMKHSLNKIIIEEGVRFNQYSITSEAHGDKDSLLAVTDGWMPAFSHDYTTFSGSLGFAYSPAEQFLIKLNLATGYRAPNMGELATNGFHEGAVYYEQGDNTLKNEQNFEGDLSLRYGTGSLKIEGAVFYNRVLNFIYLAQADSFFLSRYVYFDKQTDATLYGGEAAIDWQPGFIKWLDLKSTFSTVTAVDDLDNFLPFMPADKITTDVKFSFKDHKKLSDAFAMVSVVNVLEQWRTAPPEFITPAYMLLNVSLGGILKVKSSKIQVNLFCNNALNAYYFDHLSRIKPGTMPAGLGFYGMGRNFGVVIKIPIGK